MDALPPMHQSPGCFVLFSLQTCLAAGSLSAISCNSPRLKADVYGQALFETNDLHTMCRQSPAVCTAFAHMFL